MDSLHVFLVIVGALYLSIVCLTLFFASRGNAQVSLGFAGANMLILFAMGLVYITFFDTEERDRSFQEKELKAMGFSSVDVGYIDNADTKLPRPCTKPDLSLHKKGDIWYISTEEIASDKPVVSVEEVLNRPEVKWWCSKPVSSS